SHRRRRECGAFFAPKRGERDGRRWPVAHFAKGGDAAWRTVSEGRAGSSGELRGRVCLFPACRRGFHFLDLPLPELTRPRGGRGTRPFPKSIDRVNGRALRSDAARGARQAQRPIQPPSTVRISPLT